MIAKQIYGIIRKSAITALVTSYLTRSFYLWNYNPSTWTETDRGMFLAGYVLVFLIYGFASGMILDGEISRIKREEEAKKRGW